MSDYGHDLAFGAFITPSAADPQRTVALAQVTERAGLDLATFQDHPYQPAFLDTWTLMSYAAAVTERIHLSANVINLPLRPPGVLARSAASLDLLSGGRVDLALGAGAFWDAIEAMGGPRLAPGDAVQALEEAIEVIHTLWDTSVKGGVRIEGEHYRVVGAKRGPAPAHDIPIWIGAGKPRMLRLIGRRAEGWLPSLSWLGGAAEIDERNAVIDESAESAGRDPRAIRRLLNVGGEIAAERLAELALAHGFSTFIFASDDPVGIERFGQDIAPAVRELVARGRAGIQRDSNAAGAQGDPTALGAERAGSAVPQRNDQARHEAFGVTPTPPPATRWSDQTPWDETTRPSGPDLNGAVVTDRGRQVSQHLVDVHDMLRGELDKVRDIVDQVVRGATGVGAARSAINEMTLRQNDWTLGGYCQAYCRIVTGHHTLEDEGIFSHLRVNDPGLTPVIERLEQEHRVIHGVLEGLDKALVELVANPGDHTGIIAAVDLMTDTLLSHFAYEERELVGPLARHGMYAGQL